MSLRKPESIIETTEGDVKIVFERKETTSTSVDKSLNNSVSSNVKVIYISTQQIPRGIYTDEPTFSKIEF